MGYYLGKGGGGPIPLPIIGGKGDQRTKPGDDPPVRADCIERCEETRRRLQGQGVDPAIVQQRYQACLARCGQVKDPVNDPNKDACLARCDATSERLRERGVPEDVISQRHQQCVAGCNRSDCVSDADCPTGQKCIGGKCVEPSGRCQSDADCPTGQKCVDGKCVDKTLDGDGCEGGYKLADKPLGATGGSIWTDDLITAEMGFYRNSAHQGHYIHKGGKFYLLSDVRKAIKAGTTPTPLATTSACQKRFQFKTIGGEAWCCPAGGNGNGNGDDTDGVGKVFEFPPEMMELYRNLINRGGEFLGRRPGFSDPMMRSMYGKDFDILRRRGAGQAQSLEDMIAGQGLLGTGTARDIYQKQAWETERGIGDLTRDLALSNEMQKRKDLQEYTKSAQSIFGQGASFNTIIEQLNAARRGEAQGSMAMMLQYLMALMNSWRA